MKRKALLLGVGVSVSVLAASGTWMQWQHKKEEARARAAEVKRLEEEAQAKAEALQKEAEQAIELQRINDAPLDTEEGPHFAFSHHINDRIGYEYESEKRPPLYSHLVCDDGVIQPMTFDYGWITPESESYDFYKVPVASKGYDHVCLSIRKEDWATYKTIAASRKSACDKSKDGNSCEVVIHSKDCSDIDKAAILSLAGHEKDTVRWCKFGSAGERFGFLQAITQHGKACKINSWLVDGGKLQPMDDTFNGEFMVEEGSKKPGICVFPSAEDDIPEEAMIRNGGPTQLSLMFELGQKTYLVAESSGSEVSTSTLYRLNDDKLEKIVGYGNLLIDHDFWTSTGEPILKAPKAAATDL